MSTLILTAKPNGVIINHERKFTFKDKNLKSKILPGRVKKEKSTVLSYLQDEIKDKDKTLFVANKAFNFLIWIIQSKNFLKRRAEITDKRNKRLGICRK